MSSSSPPRLQVLSHVLLHQSSPSTRRRSTDRHDHRQSPRTAQSLESSQSTGDKCLDRRRYRHTPPSSSHLRRVRDPCCAGALLSTGYHHQYVFISEPVTTPVMKPQCTRSLKWRT
ncbi:Uncharacterized protein Rs2_15671 [Raphanus sativus]|nr:Uncharacterized protein Rs2_15671 [Raphanus sativus]